jgi:hypothetical protein
MPLKYAA